jgi:hypothetical protein
MNLTALAMLSPIAGVSNGRPTLVRRPPGGQRDGHADVVLGEDQP